MAARIPALVYSDPRLNNVIQFISVAVPVGAGMMDGNSNDDQ
jgi:hypothetical protein